MANFAFSASGKSIILFGSTVHGGGANYSSLVVSVDPALKDERNLEFPRKPFKDIGFIRAAAPSGEVGEFVVARRVLAVGSDDLPEAGPPKMKLGLALDYLHF